MPHMRLRHLTKKIQALMRFSPIVGLLGHRQVGKTTLMKTTLMESLVNHYLTFDDEDTLIAAQKSPKSFLQALKGTGIGIDECQLCEKIFSALKEHVRNNKRPGQYLLSGSVRFTSKNTIKESLTGRIVTLDLYPLTLSELHGRPLPIFWKKALLSAKLDENTLKTLDPKSTKPQAEKYIDTGGLPGVCFIRTAASRSQRLTSYLETILDRDVRKVIPTSLPYPQILTLLRSLAISHGTPLNLSFLTKTTGISPPTIKKLLYAFEAVFLIRSLPLEGDLGSMVYFFEDLCEANHLAPGGMAPESKINQLLFQEIRAALLYAELDYPVRFFQYRTRAGVIVPIVVESHGHVLGVIPIEDDTPSRQEKAAGDSLLKRYANSKIIYGGLSTKTRILNDRSAIVPFCQTF